MTVVAATPGDREAVAGVLAAAFCDDPVWAWMIPAHGRERRLRRLFGALARHALTSGYARMTAGHRAVALWSPPGAWKLPPRALLSAAPTVARAAGHRLPRLLRRLSDIEAHHAKQPADHWYLEFLAVHPSAQGRGLGAVLLAEGLGRFDLPVYLESSNPRNLAFYRRNGFTVAEDLTFRQGPPQWTLWHRRP